MHLKLWDLNAEYMFTTLRILAKSKIIFIIHATISKRNEIENYTEVDTFFSLFGI